MAGTLWVIGDSWSDPQSRRMGLNGWPQQVADRLGLGLVNAASSGAGYARWNGVPINFPIQAVRTALPHADVTVVFGSVNDWASAQDPSAVAASAAATYRFIRGIAPSTELLVLGPQFWTTPPSSDDTLWHALLNAVRTESARADAHFIDTSLWFVGYEHLIDASNHPAIPGGDRRLADLITPHVLAALLKRHLAGGFTYPVQYPLQYDSRSTLTP